MQLTSDTMAMLMSALTNSARVPMSYKRALLPALAGAKGGKGATVHPGNSEGACTSAEIRRLLAPNKEGTFDHMRVPRSTSAKTVLPPVAPARARMMEGARCVTRLHHPMEIRMMRRMGMLRQQEARSSLAFTLSDLNDGDASMRRLSQISPARSSEPALPALRMAAFPATDLAACTSGASTSGSTKEALDGETETSIKDRISGLLDTTPRTWDGKTDRGQANTELGSISELLRIGELGRIDDIAESSPPMRSEALQPGHYKHKTSARDRAVRHDCRSSTDILLACSEEKPVMFLDDQERYDPLNSLDFMPSGLNG